MQNNSRDTSRPSFIDMIKDPGAERIVYYQDLNDALGALHRRICGEPVNAAGDMSQEKVLRIIEGFAEEQSSSPDKLTVATHADHVPCCTHEHETNDGACCAYEVGASGRCVYCDHGAQCHPGKGST